MINRLIISIILLLISTILFGQQEKYIELTEKAHKYYKLKDYNKSSEFYEKAFNLSKININPDDRYNLACSYSLNGKTDSAFFHLNILANTGYSKLNYFLNDNDFNLIRNDKRWKTFIEKIKVNKDEAEKGFDKKLITILDSVYYKDQHYRKRLRETEKKYGKNSPELNELWDKIKKNDSENVVIVTQIIDEKGWLGKNIIGENGPTTMFLVIQHSNIDIQLKYLPIMKDAVSKGNAPADGLALLEDRIAIRQGKKQIYGSQIGKDKNGNFYVLPLIDPDNVNKRRAKVGLGTIEEYVKYWNIEWNVDKFKKRMKEIDNKNKKRNANNVQK